MLELLGLQQVGALEGLAIVGLLIGSYFTSVAYDGFVTRQKDLDPQAGYDGWLVLVGVAYVLAYLLPILAILTGWTAAVSIAAMAAVFIIALIPMIKGDMQRAMRQRTREEEMQTQLKKMAAQLEALRREDE